MHFFAIDSKRYSDSAKRHRIVLSRRFLGSFGESWTVIETIVLAKPQRAAEAPGGIHVVFGQI
jgi:hypothetical protein